MFVLPPLPPATEPVERPIELLEGPVELTDAVSPINKLDLVPLRTDHGRLVAHLAVGRADHAAADRAWHGEGS